MCFTGFNYVLTSSLYFLQIYMFEFLSFKQAKDLNLDKSWMT